MIGVISVKKFLLLCLVFCMALSFGGTAFAAQTPSCTDEMTIGELATARMTHGGLSRLYYYYIPSTYNPHHKTPLMITLHGSGYNAQLQLLDSHFVELAEREGFIVIAPNSVAIHSDGTLSSEGYTAAELGVAGSNVRWNACPATDPQNQYGVDDVGYISALIDYFDSKLNIDTKRVYACGMSHGAFMSIRLALMIPEKLAGIGSVSGLLASEYANFVPTDSMKIVFIHGDTDPVVPIGGMVYSGWVFAYSLDDTIKYFMEHYRLKNDPSKVTELPRVVENDPTKIVRYEYKKKGNAQIVKYVVEGGGHTWPGGTQYLPPEWIGALSNQAQASELIWNELKTAHK